MVVWRTLGRKSRATRSSLLGLLLQAPCPWLSPAGQAGAAGTGRRPRGPASQRPELSHQDGIAQAGDGQHVPPGFLLGHQNGVGPLGVAAGVWGNELVSRCRTRLGTGVNPCRGSVGAQPRRRPLLPQPGPLPAGPSGARAVPQRRDCLTDRPVIPESACLGRRIAARSGSDGDEPLRACRLVGSERNFCQPPQLSAVAIPGPRPAAGGDRRPASSPLSSSAAMTGTAVEAEGAAAASSRATGVTNRAGSLREDCRRN